MSSLPFRCCLLLTLLLAGCGFFAPTVSVREVGEERMYEELNAYVLTSGELSAGSRDVLHTFGLADVTEDDARAALKRLHELNAAEPMRIGLFALSELAYLIADEDDDQDAFLASAVYAYLYLLGQEAETPPSPYDRRFRQACDLYNRALLRALATPDGRRLLLKPGRRQLPVGSIDLTVDRSDFPGTALQYPDLFPADRYRISGLTLRLRDAGLGVALIAAPDATSQGATPGEDGAASIPAGMVKRPATLFLRVDGGITGIRDGVTGTLELHETMDSSTVVVDGREVPLESDISVVLAHALHQSPLWKFSLAGLFQGDLAVNENKLRFVRPPERGKIPVVFVHGTASNPAYWAEMFNVLLNDPVLRKRTQCWFYQYASGNPLLYSAMTLRKTLQDTIASLDPDGTDPDLRRMVLIGHSQGGLVCRLMVVKGEMAWFEEIVGQPLAEFDFSEQQLALLTRAFAFEPLPFVTRTVFIATPQRGSFQAGRWASRMMAKLISLPGELTGTMTALFKDEEKLPVALRGRLPTSLDNMNPESKLLKILVNTPVAEDVTLNSIIPIGDADPNDPAELAEADDGVVEYTSAHIDGVESELLLSTGHSCQDYPAAIAEVRRLLRLQLEDPLPPAPPPETPVDGDT